MKDKAEDLASLLSSTKHLKNQYQTANMTEERHLALTYCSTKNNESKRHIAAYWGE
jgi:hypothetical protein